MLIIFKQQKVNNKQQKVRGNGRRRGRDGWGREQPRFSSHGRDNNTIYNQLSGLPQRNCQGRINRSGREFWPTNYNMRQDDVTEILPDHTWSSTIKT